MLYEISFPDGRKTEYIEWDSRKPVSTTMLESYNPPFKLTCAEADRHPVYCFYTDTNYPVAMRFYSIGVGELLSSFCVSLDNKLRLLRSERESILAAFQELWDLPKGCTPGNFMSP